MGYQTRSIGPDTVELIVAGEVIGTVTYRAGYYLARTPRSLIGAYRELAEALFYLRWS